MQRILRNRTPSIHPSITQFINSCIPNLITTEILIRLHCGRTYPGTRLIGSGRSPPETFQLPEWVKGPQIPLEDRNSNRSAHRPLSKSASTLTLRTSWRTALEAINLRNSQSNRDMSVRKAATRPRRAATVVTTVLNAFCPRSSDANLLHISCLSRTHLADTCIEQ